MNNIIRSILFVFVLLTCAACAKSERGTVKKAEPAVRAVSATAQAGVVTSSPSAAFAPFLVYGDKASRNRYTPSGYMPTGECVSLDDGWQYDVQEGKTCIRIVYDVTCSRESRKWAGVYWQNPADNWGERKGGYNLTGATRLVFWAKGELGAERIEEFRVGGLGANALYPDSDSVFIGPVLLTKAWKRYEIDLRGKDLSYISGGFSWVANVKSNPHHCTFYLDGVMFE